MELKELAEEIKKEDPLEFVTIQIQEDEYALQIRKGKKAKYGREGDTWLYFLTEDKSPCITLVFSESEVHLESYYFKAPETCRRIPHDIFFNHFLSPLAKLLGASEMNLNDASTKKFKNCTVPMIFFALAGKSTFYKRFGFESPIFDESVKMLRKSTLAELSMVESPGILFNDYELTRIIKESGFFYKKMSTVAKFVIDTCRDGTDIALAKHFIKYFNAKFFIENNFVKKLGGRKTRKRSV